jgi:hypothetical protein
MRARVWLPAVLMKPSIIYRYILLMKCHQLSASLQIETSMRFFGSEYVPADSKAPRSTALASLQIQTSMRIFGLEDVPADDSNGPRSTALAAGFCKDCMDILVTVVYSATEMISVRVRVSLCSNSSAGSLIWDPYNLMHE